MNKDKLKERLTQAGLLDENSRMRFTSQSLSQIVKHSGHKESAVARYIKTYPKNFTVWVSGAVSPTILILRRLRQETGVILYFGDPSALALGRLFQATPQGLASALALTGCKQTHLAVKVREDVGRINKFLAGKYGERYGLTAEIWIKYADALDVCFEVPPYKEEQDPSDANKEPFSGSAEQSGSGQSGKSRTISTV